MLAILCDAIHQEEVGGEQRAVLRLAPQIAPVKVAVFPLGKQLAEAAHRITADLRRRWHTEFDVSGSIGRRYRRQDEIGTPYCVTYDPESEQDQKVTVRDRDSMQQERIAADQLESYLSERLEARP